MHRCGISSTAPGAKYGAWYDRVFSPRRRTSPMSTVNSFGTRTSLTTAGRTYQTYSLQTLERGGFPEIARLPYSMKILLENLLRHEDGRFVKASDVEAL